MSLRNGYLPVGLNVNSHSDHSNPPDTPKPKLPIFSYWDYMTCVNIGILVGIVLILIAVLIFGILGYKVLLVIRDYEANIAPNVQKISGSFASYLSSYDVAVSGQSWTMRGVVDNVFPRNDLEVRDYARRGAVMINSTEVLLGQLVKFHIIEFVAELRPLMKTLDPETVATILQFTAAQIGNGTMERLIAVLLDDSPGSLHSILVQLAQSHLLDSMGSPQSQQILENVGVWAARLSDPTRIDGLLDTTTAVGQLVTDMHTTGFINRTSQSLFILNTITGSGVL